MDISITYSLPILYIQKKMLFLAFFIPYPLQVVPLMKLVLGGELENVIFLLNFTNGSKNISPYCFIVITLIFRGGCYFYINDNVINMTFGIYIQLGFAIQQQENVTGLILEIGQNFVGKKFIFHFVTILLHYVFFYFQVVTYWAIIIALLFIIITRSERS